MTIRGIGCVGTKHHQASARLLQAAASLVFDTRCVYQRHPRINAKEPFTAGSSSPVVKLDDVLYTRHQEVEGSNPVLFFRISVSLGVWPQGSCPSDKEKHRNPACYKLNLRMLKIPRERENVALVRFSSNSPNIQERLGLIAPICRS